MNKNIFDMYQTYEQLDKVLPSVGIGVWRLKKLNTCKVSLSGHCKACGSACSTADRLCPVCQKRSKNY